MLVDAHCHLGDTAFDADRAEVLARAREEGVSRIVVIGESLDAADRAIALAARHPMLSATAGVHPHIASSWSAQTRAQLRQRLTDPVVVAVGETGLDYHYDHSPRPIQRDAFDAQLELAAESGKPAVVHARDADADVITALRAHPGARVVLHSFSSGMELFTAALELGHYISFSGMATFRSWTLDDAVRATPLDRLLVETDAPYLAPVPHRGSRNEPAWVTRVADRIAAVRDMPAGDLAAAISSNAVRLFGARLAPNPECV